MEVDSAGIIAILRDSGTEMIIFLGDLNFFIDILFNILSDFRNTSTPFFTFLFQKMFLSIQYTKVRSR